MYAALKKLFENENPSRILALKDQLRQVKFTKDELISSYFLKIAQSKDQLESIDESSLDIYLVLTYMGGIPSKWNPFLKGICAYGQLPTFDLFWLECIQEETREIASTLKEKEEELDLASKIGKKKGKCNKGKKEIKSVQNPSIKKDKSNLKCFNCGKLGHFA